MNRFPEDFRPTKDAIPDFMAIGPPSPSLAAQAHMAAAAARREREAHEAHLREVRHPAAHAHAPPHAN